MGKHDRLVRTVGAGDITIDQAYYAAVSNGSNIRADVFPQFALWATNMASAPPTKESSTALALAVL